MALLELTLVTVYFDQICVNRWNYVSTGTPAAVTLSFALTSSFGLVGTAPDGGFPFGTVANNIRVNLSSSVRFSEALCRNVYSVTDFYATPLVDKFGAVQGQGMSPAIAYGFRTNRVRTDIGRGYKRFVGVTEEDVSAGGVISPSRLQDLNALASAMSSTLIYVDEGQNITFVPVVCKKERYQPSPTTKAYRYFADESQQLQNVATSVLWQPYVQVRTQVSRQYGRGT